MSGRSQRALRSGKGPPVGSSAKLASMSQPALSLLFRPSAAARLSSPDLLLSARSPFSRSRRNLGQPPALSARDDFALCRFVHLLAKSLEHRIAYRMRWRDRDNLVRARLGGRWRLLTARLV